MTPARDQFDSTSFETASGGTSQSLVDLCTDAFLLIFYIHDGKDPGQPDQLHEALQHEQIVQIDELFAFLLAQRAQQPLLGALHPRMRGDPGALCVRAVSARL